MRRYIALVALTAAAALFAVPAFASESSGDVRHMTQQEREISTELAALLEPDQMHLPAAVVATDQQVAKRYYRHGRHHKSYYHGRGHYDHRGHHHDHYRHRGHRHHYYRPYYGYGRPYYGYGYGYGGGFYYGRPGFRIGIGF